MACEFWHGRKRILPQSARRTETNVVVAVGGTEVRRLIVERAATQHTATQSSPSEKLSYQKSDSVGDACRLAEHGRSNSLTAV